MKSHVVALVKIQGVVLMFFGLISLTYFHSYYQNLRAPHPEPGANLSAELDFAGCVVRFALYWAAGLLLVAKADPIVTRLAAGDPKGDDPKRAG